MLPWRTPAWLNDISTLDTSPSSPFPTLKLVAHDGVEVTFPALPLLAVSSSLAQLVTETLMNNSDSCAVVHLPVSWEAVKIVKKLVLLGFATSDSISNTATSKEVLEVLVLLGIEENINFVKEDSTRNLVTERSKNVEIKISYASQSETKSEVNKMGEALVDMFDNVEEASYWDKEDFDNNEKEKGSRNEDVARTEKKLVDMFDSEEDGSYGDVEDLHVSQTGSRKENIARTGNAKIKQDITETTYSSVLKRHKKSVSCDLCPAQFGLNASLKRHKQAVHEVLTYPCDLCTYRAPYQGNLIRHIKSVHEGVKYPCKYPCNLCSLQFVWPSALKKHKKRVH